MASSWAAHVTEFGEQSVASRLQSRMRMILLAAFSVAALGAGASSRADENTVTFEMTTGETLRGKLIQYVGGYFVLEDKPGHQIEIRDTYVKRIGFDARAEKGETGRPVESKPKPEPPKDAAASAKSGGEEDVLRIGRKKDEAEPAHPSRPAPPGPQAFDAGTLSKDEARKRAADAARELARIPLASLEEVVDAARRLRELLALTERMGEPPDVATKLVKEQMGAQADTTANRTKLKAYDFLLCRSRWDFAGAKRIHDEIERDPSSDKKIVGAMKAYIEMTQPLGKDRKPERGKLGRE